MCYGTGKGVVYKKQSEENRYRSDNSLTDCWSDQLPVSVHCWDLSRRWYLCHGGPSVCTGDCFDRERGAGASSTSTGVQRCREQSWNTTPPVNLVHQHYQSTTTTGLPSPYWSAMTISLPPPPPVYHDHHDQHHQQLPPPRLPVYHHHQSTISTTTTSLSPPLVYHHDLQSTTATTSPPPVYHYTHQSTTTTTSLPPPPQLPPVNLVQLCLTHRHAGNHFGRLCSPLHHVIHSLRGRQLDSKHSF